MAEVKGGGNGQGTVRQLVTLPKGCNVCGAETENLKLAFGGAGFLVLETPVPGVVFLACPRCNALMVNPGAFAHMVKRQESKIVLASGMDDGKLKRGG